MGCGMVSHCGTDLHFPNNWPCGTFFHVLISHLYIFKPFAHWRNVNIFRHGNSASCYLSKNPPACVQWDVYKEIKHCLWKEQLGKKLSFLHSSVQFSSVAQSCPTLCDPMNRSRPGLPVHHHLPEFTQTHVHWVRDAIQPSHPLSSPSPPAPNPSQHQSLFQWVSSWHQVAKVLEFQLQHQSFQWKPRTDLL